MLLKYFIFCFFFGSIICYITGFWAYFKNRSSLINRTWLLLSTSSGTWSLSHLLMAITNDYQVAKFISYLVYISAILIPPFYFYFVLSLINEINKRKYELLFSFFISILFLFLLSHKYFIIGVFPISVFNYYDRLGYIGLWFFTYFVLISTYALVLLLFGLRKTSGIKRVQLKYVAIASVLGFTGGGQTFLLAFNINIPPYLIILFSLGYGTIAYSIIKYRLMNIDLAYRGGLIFTSYLLILLLFYIPLGLVLKETTLGFILFAIFTAGFSPFAYKYISKATQKAVDKGIFRGRFDYFETLLNDIENAKPLYKLNEVASRIVKKIAKDMKVENCCILMHEGWHDEFPIRAENIGRALSEEENRMPKKLSKDAPLIKYFERENKPLMKEEIANMTDEDNTPIMNAMSVIHSEIAMPIYADQKLIGILGIGRKKTGDIFDDADLKILDKFLKDNENEIVYTYFMEERHLFSAKTAHDMRGPIGHIKSSLEELKSELYGPLNKVQKECLDSAIESTEISRRNLEQFFELSIIEQKVMKGEYVLVPVDIVEIAENKVEKFKPEARKKGIEIKLEVSNKAKSIMVKGNKEDLGRVFENLISNAIKHTKKGTITLYIDVRVGGVICRVEDTGAGIPEHCIPHVFKPFFHLHSLGEQKQQGTGLGLVIVKEIIDAHGGREWVESKEGQGTTFYFTLSFAK